MSPADGHGTFGELARAVRATAEAARARPSNCSRVQRHAARRFSRHFLRHGAARERDPADVHAVITQAQPNWTVESVDAPGQVWGKDLKPIHVQAVIAGYGTAAAQRTASLVVNGKTTASKTVAVPANGRVNVEFPALEAPYGFSRCEVKIDSADGFPADDLRRFAIERTDPQKVLLIHNYGDNRSPLYIGAALSAAAQSAFLVESINVNEAADRKPSNYAFIILSDVNNVPSLLGKFASLATCAPVVQSSSSPPAPPRAPACRFLFSAHASLRPAITAAFPIVLWRLARATPPIPPSPRRTAGRA